MNLSTIGTKLLKYGKYEVPWVFSIRWIAFEISLSKASSSASSSCKFSSSSASWSWSFLYSVLRWVRWIYSSNWLIVELVKKSNNSGVKQLFPRYSMHYIIIY